MRVSCKRLVVSFDGRCDARNAVSGSESEALYSAIVPLGVPLEGGGGEVQTGNEGAFAVGRLSGGGGLGEGRARTPPFANASILKNISATRISILRRLFCLFFYVLLVKRQSLLIDDLLTFLRLISFLSGNAQARQADGQRNPTARVKFMVESI
jgi:hypothetical protein